MGMLWSGLRGDSEEPKSTGCESDEAKVMATGDTHGEDVKASRAAMPHDQDSRIAFAGVAPGLPALSKGFRMVSMDALKRWIWRGFIVLPWIVAIASCYYSYVLYQDNVELYNMAVELFNGLVRCELSKFT